MTVVETQSTGLNTSTIVLSLMAIASASYAFKKYKKNSSQMKGEHFERLL
jgi:hypothetical protein